MKNSNTSLFGVIYEQDGERVVQKFMDTGSSAEYEAKKYSNKFKKNVELWHFPSYGNPIKLCTALYRFLKVVR
jgi:hypothetical protein